MERKLIKGETLEEHIDSIDLILQSWAPRLGTNVIGVIPPIPILHRQLLPEVDGTILKMLLPFSGSVVAAYISIGKYNVKPATIDIWTTGTIGFGGTSIVCDKALHIYFPESWQVTAGSLLRATVDPPTAIEDINIGVLVHVEIAQAYKERYLVEALRKIE